MPQDVGYPTMDLAGLFGAMMGGGVPAAGMAAAPAMGTKMAPGMGFMPQSPAASSTQRTTQSQMPQQQQNPTDLGSYSRPQLMHWQQLYRGNPEVQNMISREFQRRQMQGIK